MAITNKALDEKLRSAYLTKVMEFFSNSNEEVLRTNSNEICLPCVDESGNEKYITITFKVPTGSRDGEKYDGYVMSADYAHKVAEKEAKAKEKAEAKAKKMARDAKNREKKG